MRDTRHARRGSTNALAHVVRVDHGDRCVVSEVILEFVREAHIDERSDGADAPASKQAKDIIHAVVRKDGDTVTFAHADFVQRARVAFHRDHGVREGEFNIAIDPVKSDLLRSARCTIDQQLMHQHGLIPSACRPFDLREPLHSSCQPRKT
jgi:hypothetical protein